MNMGISAAFDEGLRMLSMADISLSGVHFIGIISVALSGEKEYGIATYLGAKIKQITNFPAKIKSYANLQAERYVLNWNMFDHKKEFP